MAVSISSVQTNMLAMNSGRMLGINAKSLAKSTEKLSSGYRINRAADDAAGLAISEKLRYQIRGLNQGAENIQDGISLCQVADGALSDVDDMLHRMNELSVKSANATLTLEDRSYIQEEVDQLTDEINRIGATTTFNEIHIFDKETIEGQVGKLSSLVSSPSAENGYVSEAFQGNDGKYYPSTSMDFSKVNASNVSSLDGGYFSITCPYGCGEVFNISFAADTDASSGPGSGNHHQYSIGIKGATGGADVVDRLYSYISSNLPSTASSIEATKMSAVTGGVGVSHRSALVKNGAVLTVATNPGIGFSTAQQAINEGILTSSTGKVDVSGLTSIMTIEPVYTINIQCSSNDGDVEKVTTKLMNGEALTVDPLDVSTQLSAYSAIDKVKYALSYIANLRSTIGAQQNRLEHSYDNNLNISENETAAESQIRDTDMAGEMVKYSLQNILSQAGQSMLTQANQSQQGVLSLLQ